MMFAGDSVSVIPELNCWQGPPRSLPVAINVLEEESGWEPTVRPPQQVTTHCWETCPQLINHDRAQSTTSHTKTARLCKLWSAA